MRFISRAVVGCSLLSQLSSLDRLRMVELPILQKFFNIVKGGLSVEDWAIILIGSSLVLWLERLGI